MEARETVTVNGIEHIEVTRSELEHFGFYQPVVDGRGNIYVPLDAFKRAKGYFNEILRTTKKPS